ncbi:MAG TPA: hypothetical protein VLL54_16570 [Pyrinomonadaceae bacterium]|nr:hypothetical protein [Pyrinomonadaceae bacterium]
MRTHKIQMRVAFAIVFMALLASGAIWEVRRARASNPQPDPPGRYPIVGIVRGQSIRINASNIAPSDSNTPPDPCRVRLGFVDADGNPLTNPRTGEAVGRTVTLQNGQSAFLHVNADEFSTGDTAPGRLQLRPVFRSVTLNPNGQLPPDPCVPSVEVINNATQRTSFIYAGTPSFGDPPDPDRPQ